MSIIQPLNSAATGIIRGLEGIKRNAAEIASADQMNGTANKDLTTPLVEIKHHQFQVEAAAKMVKTTDEMIGSLIDVIA